MVWKRQKLNYKACKGTAPHPSITAVPSRLLRARKWIADEFGTVSLAPWDGSTSTLQLPNRAQRRINFYPNPIGSEVMYEKPHINGTSSVRTTEYQSANRSLGYPAEGLQHTNIAHARILTATVATAPARNSARKLISSIVPQFQGYGVCIIWRSCYQIQTRQQGSHCSSLQRSPCGRSTKLRIVE
jgi:hypothetical protein